MFICTVRAQTVRFAGVLCLALAILFGVAVIADAGAAIVPPEETVETVSFSRVKTDEDRLKLLTDLGWKTSGNIFKAEWLRFWFPKDLPETFDRVLLGYNEIQKDQGLDLTRYRKKKVTRYTYEITNYPDYEGRVYANLIVWRGRVIAGDISSADPMGFVRGLEADPG